MTTENRLVSVVIPSYKRPDFAREAVRSVLASDYRPLEVIVVDDGSPVDCTGELAAEFATEPVTVLRQANAGVYAARNRGASHAVGEYLLFLDDDDLLLPGAISFLVAELQARPAYVGAAGRCLVEQTGEAARSDWANLFGDMDSWDLLVNRIMTPGQVLIRRSAYTRTGGFLAGLQGAEDWYFWVQLTRFGKLHVANTLVLRYRLHGANMSGKAVDGTTAPLLVAGILLRTTCPAHRSIARVLLARSLYEYRMPVLRDAVKAARLAGDRRTLALLQKLRLYLVTWMLVARARKFASSAVRHRRWRMSTEEQWRVGRECRACAALAEEQAVREGAPPVAT